MNDEVALILHEIGDMLDILGEDTFRVLSYQRAARAIEALTTDIEELVRTGRLEEITGVGPAIRDKITEYVTTDRLAYYDELKSKIPPGVLDLLRVRGLGPKKVAILWKQLGISDLKTLEDAAKTHRLRRVKGFGEKTEENILRAIDVFRQGQSRTIIWDAARIAEAIEAHLKAHAAIEQIVAAGSFRRMRETVGDLDILVTTRDRSAAVKAFVSYPEIKEVYMQGDIKASVLVEYVSYEEGRKLIQVDLELLDPENWGAGLQYFTGNKDHNVKLRTMAVGKGLKLNEYGVYRGEEKLAGETEESVYGALGLPWIPPELREDAGEIEAARTNTLPNLIALGDIQGDFHVHTNETDGAEPLPAMVGAAQKRGYSYVGISDHSVSATIARGLTAEMALARRDRFRELNARLKGFTVLMGTECDILDGGEMDYPDEVLREFDYVVGSVHSKFGEPKGEMTARVIAAVENPQVNILGHPNARLLGKREPIALDLDAVFAAAAKAGTAIEVNAGPSRMDVTGPQARSAQAAGCKLTVDTDAHSSLELESMRLGVGTARRGWLTREDVVNAWPLERVRDFFS